MNASGWIQLAAFAVPLALLAGPLGAYLARVYAGEPCGLDRVLGPGERLIYRLVGVDPRRDQSWREYAASFLWFNAVSFAAVFALQLFQHVLPLNPAERPAVTWDSAFNTAVSFATNTNWQGYSGEVALSYLTQSLGLTTQNFVSAAGGMAVMAAFARGFARREARGIGNFWSDLVRGTLYVLLPLSVVFAVFLVGQGVVQTWDGPVAVPAADGVAAQTIARGPAASQVAIKQLGTNGGGFFNANSAHPLENPTPLSNLLQCLAILAIPAACATCFGRLVGDRRQGRTLLAAMWIVFLPAVVATYAAEAAPNPAFAAENVDARAAADAPGGNMEGKEARFGVAPSALWAVATTAASNGSVNSMHDSYSPLGGLWPMWLMQLGEVVFGGVGSGLYGLAIFALVAVFLAGLMIGRTPEYLGKKIEAFEVKMASLAVLLPCVAALVGTAAAVATETGRAGVANPGAHGFSEILYAFSSAANNNGSAFAGLSANTPFYNLALGVAMLIGRYGVAVPALAIAGSLAAKRKVPETAGTLPTHGPLFVFLLVGVVVLVGALTFAPALALGPLVEHLRIGR